MTLVTTSKRFSIANSSSIGDALERASQFLDAHHCFYGHGTDNAWDEVVSAFVHFSGISHHTGPEILQEPFPEEHSDIFEIAVNRRAIEKMPMPYITGIAWFCGHQFHVNRNTLIPRSPMAELIQSEFRPWLTERPSRILDLCCGSGCIGIAAALLNESAAVVLSDVSAEAIEVAQQNIRRHELESRVAAVKGDLFEKVTPESFDVILCNPPYVDIDDLTTMPEEYHQEPILALEAGDDGLDLARKVLQRSANYLTDNGALILEVGNSWRHLEKAYPNVSFTWVEFEHGGHGVCVMLKAELEQYA